ncbi:hypothetical protein DXG03_001184 [Asterophora parasitica]|uniref:Uncharacterized protein n=1 Tax=Asterophora parasitica TaxID=117018 RepID=A0A9P7KBR6_9AGAR|nr:hypothetical protein DXG03_001184 [Asterophora parasitica]
MPANPSPSTPAADPSLANPPLGGSDKAWQCLVAIEQNFQDLANAQTTTTTAIQDLTRQLADLATALNNTPAIPPAVVLSPAPVVVVKPAPAVAAPESHKSCACLLLLATFTGDHSDGRQFIQACKLYFTMAPASHFASHTRAIGWALMQMQEGHGANYVECIVQEGITQFTSWEDFWDSFA